MVTTYGQLLHGVTRAPSGREQAWWVVKATPYVQMRIKRMFPRARPDRNGVVLAATPDVARDLEWLIDRHPLEISNEDRRILTAAAAAHRETETLRAAIIAGDHQVDGLKEPARTPRPYQLQAADLCHTTGHLLLGDDVGLGKTFSSLLLLRDPDTLPAVVVTLTHLPRQWQRELEASLPWLTSHIPTKGTAYDVDADVVILNYAKLAGWADHLAGQVRTVIFDEVQELRRGASAKYFAAQQIADAALWRMGLSATPVYNYGGEIHSIYQCLAPDRLGTRDEFVREWGGREWNGNVQVRDPGGLGAWLRDEGLLLRRTRKDVHRELPEPIRIVHEVDTDATALEAVKDDVAALAQLIRDRTTSTQAERFTAAGELDWMLRQATGVAKAPYVAQFVRLLLESEERVVLFGWHHDVYAIWMNALSEFRPVLYTGRETPAKKQAAFDAFTRPLDSPGFTSRVLIMSLRAGAGLDGLQEHCSVVVFGELDWSPATHDQCIGRLARDGQEATVAAYYLVANEGSDPPITEVLQLKRQQAEPIRNPNTPLLAPAPDTSDRIARLVDAVLTPEEKP